MVLVQRKIKTIEMKILLMRFSALGDVAMLAAVVREMAHQMPDDELTVLSMPFCAPLFDEIGGNVKFLGRDVKKDYKGVFGLYRLFRELHGMKFDYVCDMHDVLRTKMLRQYFRLHGYKVSKINKHRELRKGITAQGDKKVLKQLPTSFENYRECLRPLSRPSDTLPPRGKGIYADGSRKTGKIGIAPFAAHKGKIYPIEKMEEVIRLLGGECPKGERGVILFGGGGKEKDIMQQWAEKYPYVHLASETHKGLREELKLMRELDVMVSMDSANMHLASLVGTRVVSIWGATHPYAGFLGWQQRMEDCVQLDLPCRPCSIYGNKECVFGDHRCMDIKPEEIVKRINSMM